jgi:hypothetical protein
LAAVDARDHLRANEDLHQSGLRLVRPEEGCVAASATAFRNNRVRAI